VTARPGHKFTIRIEGILLTLSLGLLVVLAVLQDTSVIEPIARSRLTFFTLLFCAVAVMVMFILRRWRSGFDFVGHWAPLVLVMGVYESLKHLHANQITLWLGIAPRDSLMIAIDKALFGKVLPLWLDGITLDLFFAINRQFYSIGYYLTPVVVLALVYMAKDLPRFEELRRGIIFCLLGGYVMYIFIPVAGPLFTIGDQFKTPMPGASETFVLVFDQMRYQWDAFPSLHTALPWVITILTWERFGFPGRAALLVLAVGVTFSTIALRYHYGTDVLAGLLWAAIVCGTVRLMSRTGFDPAIVIDSSRGSWFKSLHIRFTINSTSID
jgi:membrane-associated phospholipid phosphatase